VVVHSKGISDGIDPSTTSGPMILNMLATWANYQRQLITERVNAGIAAAKQGGTRFGRPRSTPVVVADKLKLVTEARAKGRTAEDAAILLGWSHTTLHHKSASGRHRPLKDGETPPVQSRPPPTRQKFRSPPI